MSEGAMELCFLFSFTKGQRLVGGMAGMNMHDFTSLPFNRCFWILLSENTCARYAYITSSAVMQNFYPEKFCAYSDFIGSHTPSKQSGIGVLFGDYAVRIVMCFPFSTLDRI